jgi:NDP-sugar pyrophosphorylase family protein
MNVDILTDLNISNFIRLHETKGAMITLAVSDRDSPENCCLMIICI